MDQQRWYYFAGGVALFLAVISFLRGEHTVIPLLAVFISVGSFLVAQREKQRSNNNREALHSLIENDMLPVVRDNNRIRESEEAQKRRIRNIEEVLSRKGVDTKYLVNKYADQNPIYAPLITITHTRKTNEVPEYIKNKLEGSGSELIHGATKVLPPSTVTKDMMTEDGLRAWFREDILEGNDVEYKLELLTLIDLTRSYSDMRGSHGNGSKIEGTLIEEIYNDKFTVDDVINHDDFVDLVSESERISLGDELRENIGLLAARIASEDQMKQIIDNQNFLESSLGNVFQISNTDFQEIRNVLEKSDVSDPENLARGIKTEAERLSKILTR